MYICNTHILIQTKSWFSLQVFFEEHNLIIMDYSACTTNTACYYCSISCVAPSFHFCTLLFTNAVSVLYSVYLLYFSDSLSGNLPLLHFYPSLFVPKNHLSPYLLVHFLPSVLLLRTSWFNIAASFIPSFWHSNMRSTYLFPSFPLFPSSLDLAFISLVL